MQNKTKWFFFQLDTKHSILGKRITEATCKNLNNQTVYFYFAPNSCKWHLNCMWSNGRIDGPLKMVAREQLVSHALAKIGLFHILYMVELQNINK